MTTLRVQSVLFHNDHKAIERTLSNLRRAVELARAAGIYEQVEMAYGDCSTTPVFSSDQLEALRERHRGLIDLSYTFFGANLGSAKGHNTLLQEAAADHILIMNPDVVMAPITLIELTRPLQREGVGMVEARQLPIEHPKGYNLQSGETSWAATACALVPKAVFDRVGPFDSDTFFLYCDDVDFSWRVRLHGLQVIYQPGAVVFHDKRVSVAGEWLATGAEQYFSAEAALLLRYKWSRPELAEETLRAYEGSDMDVLQRAAAEYRNRHAAGRLPQQLDPERKVAQFIDGQYAQHRFAV